MVLISTTTLVLISVLLGVAAITAVLAGTALGQFLVSNRRIRLERHESIPAYYGSLAFTH